MKSNNTIPKAKSQQNLTDIDLFKYQIRNFISDSQQRFLGLLLSIRSKTGSIYPSLETISEELGYSRRTAIRDKRKLGGLGMFKSKQRGKNTSCIYFLHRFFSDPRMKDTIEWLISKFNNTPSKGGSLISRFKCDYNKIIRLSSNKLVPSLEKVSFFIKAKIWDSEFIDNLLQGWKSFTGILPKTGKFTKALADINGRIMPWEQCDINVSQLFYKDEQRRLHEERRANQRKKLAEALSRDRFFKTKEPELNPIELMRRKFSLSF